ncbi:amylo-alpha-1,6-glucosidase [Methylobacterium sp. C1]|uniref:amylo-alpha-1,6-glucosidase n=1 Tax=Methylobacterium sp. C1 TaxID=1479019 RepID=UPI0008DADD49|nr:amylo-alpha-1,6-glucosidase [Methylobacterium sp. C1]
MPEAVPLPGEACEWLEADGLGGFASGTAAGVRTRRYHALLLTAAHPPTGRAVLINGIEAWVETAAGRFDLSTQRYLPDVVHPRGFERIVAFTHDPWPSWTFRMPDGTQIVQEILVDADSCDTLLRWRRISGSGPCTLVVVPLLSGRDYHGLQSANPAFDFTPRIGGTEVGACVTWRPYRDRPAISALTTGLYRHEPDWYREFLYAAERDRGLDCVEDLAAPGSFRFDLGQSGPGLMLLRAGESAPVRVRALADRMVAAALAARAGPDLRRSAGSYRVDRGRGSTMVAGFPWFTDWGRDTFVALRGLLLATGELAAAEAILTAWAGAVSAGMMPNRFPDSGEQPEYNSADASLWYVVAVHDFLEASGAAGRGAGSEPALREACLAILDGYASGTRFGIRADADGLIAAGQPGTQLTWMDAKVGDWVVTPRVGKPVEIQALWVNALHIAAARWEPRFAAMESTARASFARRFPNPAGGLFDVVDVDHVPGTHDAALRPNQIFAVGGLPFPLLTGDDARSVVDAVAARLLTPLGLRSLSPDDPAYVGRYGGDARARDGAYHQGTVWPWLLGPFVDAWLSVRGRSEAALAEGRARFLPPLEQHLGEAGLGHVSEVADGDAPHRPGGCPFQAWSLGEYVRIRRMLGLEAF